MAGVFKSLERSDVRLTPFRAHKLFSISGSGEVEGYIYQADYNPFSYYLSQDPLQDTFDQGNLQITQNEPTTTNGKYQRVVHRSLEHLYYRDFYTNTRATFGGGNINYQYRFLEDKAQAISLPQTMFGESILQGSVKVYATYSINGISQQNLVLVDDLYGNLYPSGGITSLYSTTISSSLTKSLVGEWPTDIAYKYLGAGPVNFTGSVHRGDWQMASHYNNVVAVKTTGSTSNPSIEDLIGAGFRFTSSLNSRIEIATSVAEDYLQYYNFENGDFAISTLVRPENASTVQRGSVIIEKDGPGQRLQIDLNGNLYAEPITNRSPYRLLFSASCFRFEREGENQLKFIASSNVSLNTFHHVVAIKTGSTLQLWLNGTLAGTTSDIPNPKYCSNQSYIYIGNSHNYAKPFDGIIDSVKVYRKALTSADVTALRGTYNVGNTYVGNVFYNNGMIVLSSNPSRYMKVTQVDFRATQTIYETEILCTVNPGEFGMSMNRSLQVYDSDTNQFVYSPFISSSQFKPFVTTIGLYNDLNDLVAVGKLSTPVQLPNNMDTTFIVRFDRW